MKAINIFFAADRSYLPYLGVALYSLSEHASRDREYNLNILTTDITDENIRVIKNFIKPNIKISTVNIEKEIFAIRDLMTPTLRDYYSEAIFYRILIPTLFPNIDKAIYLDSDIVVNRDIAELYDTELDGFLIAAVTDETVITEPIFRNYVTDYVGVGSAEEYFNSGVLVMNLSAIRQEQITEKMLKLMEDFSFKTVAPDQDYLNFLCRGRVKYLPALWNKHPIPRENDNNFEEAFIMHYNMFYKPWHYLGIPNEELFWKTAVCTPFITELLEQRKNYTEEQRASDLRAALDLLRKAKDLTDCKEGFASLIYT